MIEPDGDAHGDERGDQGSEDQDEHDHRGGEPELQLPVGQVGLGELCEVVVEGVRAGDGDVEARRGVRGGDLVQHLHDAGLRVMVEYQRYNRSVLVFRDGRSVRRVGVPDGLGRAGVLDRGPDVCDKRLELLTGGAELARVDDDGLIDAVTLGEAVGDHLLCLHRVGAGGEAGI